MPGIAGQSQTAVDGHSAFTDYRFGRAIHCLTFRSRRTCSKNVRTAASAEAPTVRGGISVEGTLNRRGIFFKKLAAPDLEFFAARTASPANRRIALTINAPIAEAALPRAAQRGGYWKVEGRQYPAGAAEPFDFNRSLDWQLSGPGTEGAVVRAVAAEDWFAVQYEISPDGKVSFLWRAIMRRGSRSLWHKIEDGIGRHLVARMAHFSESHPEYDAVGALLDGATGGLEEELEGVAAGVRSLLANIALPGFGSHQASGPFSAGAISHDAPRL
ncbi:MAG TPA: hypothetical protein VIH65_04355, partial [Xanthobacteraceae bacterium]